MKRISLVLLVVLLMLSGCYNLDDTYQKEYSSAVVRKDTEVVEETKYMPGYKGMLIPYHTTETYYYLYVLNPLETTGKEVKMSVNREIYSNTKVGDNCILILTIDDKNTIVNVQLKGNKGAVGREVS